MCDHLANYPGQEVKRGHRTGIFYRTGIVRKKGLETAQRRQKKERHCLFLELSFVIPFVEAVFVI